MQHALVSFSYSPTLRYPRARFIRIVGSARQVAISKPRFFNTPHQCARDFARPPFVRPSMGFDIFYIIISVLETLLKSDTVSLLSLLSLLRRA